MNEIKKIIFSKVFLLLMIVSLFTISLISYFDYQEKIKNISIEEINTRTEYRLVLKEYANKIESENLEDAKLYYLKNGGDSARFRLIDELEKHLFVYADKYGNFHSHEVTSIYDIQQGSFGRYRNRLYIRDCKWLSGSNSSYRFDFTWVKNYCSPEFIKVQEDDYLGKLINKITTENENQRISSRNAETEEARTSSLIYFIVLLLPILLLNFSLSYFLKRYKNF